MQLLNAIFCLGIAITGVKLAYGWELACTYPPNILTALNGRITSPYHPGNYPNNALCDWHIHGPAETGVRLDFSYFYTEVSNDWVAVWEGSNTNGNSLWGRSGYHGLIPTTLINSSHMYVRFYSDGSNVYPGFMAHYNSDPACRAGPSVLTNVSGSFASPYHPDYYPPYEDCTWELTAPTGGHVELSFGNFSTQYCSMCTCDYVEVYDGGSRVGRWCGTNSPGYITSSTNRLTVRFYSNYQNVSYSGFYADYVIQNLSPENKPMLPPSIDIPLNGTARTVGGTLLTPQCLLAYENEFTMSSQTSVTFANVELENGNLCGESAGVHVLWEDSRMTIDENDQSLIHLTMLAAVPGQGEYTLNSMEVCATGVLNYLVELNNWYQPVLPNLDNCPEVVIDPYKLNDNGMQWCRPIEDIEVKGKNVIPPCKKKAVLTMDQLKAAAVPVKDKPENAAKPELVKKPVSVEVLNEVVKLDEKFHPKDVKIRP